MYGALRCTCVEVKLVLDSAIRQQLGKSASAVRVCHSGSWRGLVHFQAEFHGFKARESKGTGTRNQNRVFGSERCPLLLENCR